MICNFLNFFESKSGINGRSVLRIYDNAFLCVAQFSVRASCVRCSDCRLGIAARLNALCRASCFATVFTSDCVINTFWPLYRFLIKLLT